MNEIIEKGIEAYLSPKPENDIDLIAEVRKILIDIGHKNHVETAYDNNHFIEQAKNKPSDIQRYLLNRYWNSQLLNTPKNSVEERYCLLPSGDINDWMILFKEKIIPFVMENDLPREINYG